MGAIGVLIILIVIAAIIIGYFVTIYNGLVGVKNNIKKAWANIDVLLKQRHDEVPKLVKICEGYMQYEKKTLQDIIAARNAAYGARSIPEKSQKEGELSGMLNKLFAIAENYPDLKSQQQFQHLQQRVSDLENQIADRREFYNESVNNFNIRIQSLPDSFVAGPMGLTEQPMFKVAEADKKDVDINFNFPK